MSKSEKILVIKKNTTNKIKIKGSQFIGYVFQITSPDDVSNNLKLLRKEHYDASHYCYAYKTKLGDEKYSDDGEPNGTAGIRILNAINRFSLTDILVVVVRYFGGTKLGVGPLGKAYGESATNLLNSSEIVELTKFKKVSILYKYDDVSSIHYLLNKFKCKKIKNVFTTSPELVFYIEPFQIKKLNEELIEKTAGNANLNQFNSYSYLRL